MKRDVIVIGAGISGLSCALTLERAGLSVLVLESDSAAGGRVQTDELEGFVLDRGFQVYLSAYEEARSLLDLEALELKPFTPGSAIWVDNKIYNVLDPWRSPTAVFSAALPVHYVRVLLSA